MIFVQETPMIDNPYINVLVTAGLDGCLYHRQLLWIGIPCPFHCKDERRIS